MHAVIFDLDGTLIDSERYYMQYLIASLHEQGLELPYDAALDLRGRGIAAVEEMLLARYQKKVNFGTVLSGLTRQLDMQIQTSGVPLKPAAREVLQGLRERGYKLAVATGTALHRAECILTQAGLSAFLDQIISAESVTHSKPHPEVYRYAAQQLGERPEDCFAVEDAPVGVLSAVAAGCKTIMVPDLAEPEPALVQKLYAKANNLQEVYEILVKERLEHA